MDERVTITVDNVRSVARQVLEHRIILNFKAEAKNIKPADIIDKLLEQVKVGWDRVRNIQLPFLPSSPRIWVNFKPMY